MPMAWTMADERNFRFIFCLRIIQAFLSFNFDDSCEWHELQLSVRPWSVTLSPVKAYFHFCHNYRLLKKYTSCVTSEFRPWSRLAQQKYIFVIAIVTVFLKYTFSVTSDFRPSSSIRRTFKTSNRPTSAPRKIEMLCKQTVTDLSIRWIRRDNAFWTRHQNSPAAG